MLNEKDLLPLNLQYFAEGADEAPEEPQQESTEGQEPAAEPQNTETQNNEPDTKIPYDRFKQVNDKAKQYEQTFQELGIDSVDSLKELMSDYQAKKQAEEERERAEMTELERLQKELEEKQESEQTLAQKLEDYQAQVQQEKVRNAFIQKAQAANIAYVDDAEKLADLSAVKVNEDGEVEGVDEAVNTLIENKPFLLAQKREPRDIGEPSNFDDREQTVSSEQLLEEAAEKARKSGKTEDMAAYRKLKRELT